MMAQRIQTLGAGLAQISFCRNNSAGLMTIIVPGIGKQTIDPYQTRCVDKFSIPQINRHMRYPWVFDLTLSFCKEEQISWLQVGQYLTSVHLIICQNIEVYSGVDLLRCVPGDYQSTHIKGSLGKPTAIYPFYRSPAPQVGDTNH